ncbi:hypothetical protein CDV36_000098 [Fusarium kuroshium]|uniref:Protein kinase domain-containing protein n=1 Tax=Fusarium kuroshium TaxID=2010991 RepID=A0A3M2SRN6_9HYPO|nr:hypothetical protein CDV36_000098 [Fusarium kuroshium]
MKNEHVVHFREWVLENQGSGMNGENQTCFYVPSSRLKAYWTPDNIRKVLDSCDLQESAAQIAEKFVRVFSTLVYVGQPENITLFLRKDRDDLQLPISPLPREWPPCLGDFHDEQWMFCPLEFSKHLIYKRELHRQQILPVTYLESLRDNAWGGDGPSIHKVEIHSECNTMTEKDTPVVFKIFKGQEMGDLYRAEADVYSRLSDHPKAHKNIAMYYGSFSFERTETRIIILEYAEMGSLLKFFENTGLPVTADDFKTFWRALLKLLTGLYGFHNLGRPPLGGGSLNGFIAAIHQDIQPANILVFPHPKKSSNQKQKESRFNVRFKLADFGLAEVRRVLRPDGRFKIENEGNRMYSAPECYVNYAIESEVRPEVTTSVDVWALGAVYSDALVWSIAGEPGREAYRVKRKEAIAELNRFKAAGFEACFHNGEDKLDAVSEFHQETLQNKRESDPISRLMSDFILNDMLRVADSRLIPQTLKSRADEMMNNLERRPTVGTSTSSYTQPVSDPDPIMSRVGEDPPVPKPDDTDRPKTPQKPPPALKERAVALATAPETGSGLAPVDQMYQMLGKKKSKTYSIGRARDMFQGKHFEGSIVLPGMQSARSQIKARGGRDQIILIDNFKSMKPHMEQVARTARVIGYFTKVADNDGMDLFFTSDSTRAHKVSTSTAVEFTIRRTGFCAGKCNMANCLSNILMAVFKDDKAQIKPTSIYVYTDAKWEEDNDVESVIRDSISRLVKADQRPTTLMFQFIQFGNDPKGTAHLQHLDDNCKEKHKLGEYDIVDTKRWDDEVESIVIGSISRENDNKKPSTPR